MDLDTKTGLRVWNDSYNQHHQFIANEDQEILYERYNTTDDLEVAGLKMFVIHWTKWTPVKRIRLKKSWFVRDLTLSDLVTGNFEKEET